MTDTPPPDTTATTDVPAADTPPGEADAWDRLAAPFDVAWIEKLPKQLRRNDENKARCEEGSIASADGYHCGGWHARAVHLDYIGHAGITMRLNSAVGPGGWTFEAVHVDDHGIPVIASRGEFWGRLTILGVSC